ncbi:MAG: ribosome-associated translation inhibitor RaiA [Bacteroidales bacterium]|nr:ribosome-associated translation inhibitor RaiA [Bacteroidales bacterium]MDD2636139.1 ribosome-associated translation inhibitor RaiA [Bacteroidales bacterium]MDD4216309.1 ribosome-associated translation inhibitor RaiA [Bacteroidales bacterium]MDY0140858.1 ribosome-associated translation inhibitor RaiA [Bacteroidales bacterium]
MNIKIQSVKFDADKKLIDYIEAKVGKLSQVADDILNAEVVLKIDNSVKNGNKIAEINIDIPHGAAIFAKKQSKSFEESIDSVTVALRRQLKKFKEKQRE